jgi:hypothetical protein
MTKKAKAAKPTKVGPSPKPDDFVSVARRLGADEDKARFEEMLRKIATENSKELRRKKGSGT